MPTIDVSEYVKEGLDAVKDAEQHRSYDSVLRTLLHDYNGEKHGDE